VLIPAEWAAQPAPAASQRPVPAPRRTSHRQGSRFTRHQRGFKRFARPVFPSPVAARMERAALGLSPGLRTPPTKSRTTHAEEGTGHRARTWNYTLNSHQSISNPVVHSMRATSRRTPKSMRPLRSVMTARQIAVRTVPSQAYSARLMGDRRRARGGLKVAPAFARLPADIRPTCTFHCAFRFSAAHSDRGTERRARGSPGRDQRKVAYRYRSAQYGGGDRRCRPESLAHQRR
jgi:hypothetical protein